MWGLFLSYVSQSVHCERFNFTKEPIFIILHANKQVTNFTSKPSLGQQINKVLDVFQILILEEPGAAGAPWMTPEPV